MKLSRFRIRNFRCYGEEIAFDFDDITALIGKNDVGKSTVMDALEIFLNEGNPDRNDGCKLGDTKDLTLIAEFSDLTESVDLDEGYETSFADEYLLNEHGRLEIHKTYSGHTQAPKCTSTMAFAVHPTALPVHDLLQLKNRELKKRATELRVNLDDIDTRANAQVRERIRSAVGDLQLKPVAVPLTGDNTRNLWDALKVYIPVLALFRSDRPSSDQDPEAQDPLKMAVREALKQREPELNAIIAYVQAEVEQIAKTTLRMLTEMDPTLASQLQPQISIKKWETLFNVSIAGDEGIPINKRGSGAKRLILLNFFRAKAELQAAERKTSPVIYAIEEPETSQHPNNQRLLLGALRDLAEDNQVIFTTHTPTLARTLPDTCLRYICQKPDRTREVLHGNEETNRLIARTLGVLPDHTIKLFIGVEGKHDITFLKAIAKILRADGLNVLDLERMELDGEVLFFPLGGSSLALWTSRLQPLSRPEFHLFDRDNQPPKKAKYQDEADKINQRYRCKAIVTGKREMENYLHYAAIQEAIAATTRQTAIWFTSNFADFDDVPTCVAEAIHSASESTKSWTDVCEDKRKQKVSKAKVLLNQTAVQFMTRQRLEEVDPEGHVLSWLKEMQCLVEME